MEAINRDDLTDVCDSASCEHDSGMWHVRQAGVLCKECEAKAIRYSFDPEKCRAELDATRALQHRRLAEAGFDSNASDLESLDCGDDCDPR